jgi:hypothetical protein
MKHVGVIPGNHGAHERKGHAATHIAQCITDPMLLGQAGRGFLRHCDFSFLLFYLRFSFVLKHLTVFYNKQKRNLIEN